MTSTETYQEGNTCIVCGKYAPDGKHACEEHTKEAGEFIMEWAPEVPDAE